jgi:hypothetical protein
MNMIQVSSTNLAAIGYEETSRTLRVEFRNGGTYDYYDVPQSEFEGLRNATSHGEYLARNIKGRYRYARV